MRVLRKIPKVSQRTFYIIRLHVPESMQPGSCQAAVSECSQTTLQKQEIEGEDHKQESVDAQHHGRRKDGN
jgi:hypothetical protein